MSSFSPIGTIYAKGIDGSPVIPSSQRPDGTWRKQRRVKEGYVPQDEVPLYESKGKQAAKNKPLYPVGMPPPTQSPVNHNSGLNLPLTKRCPIPGLIIDEDYIKVMKSKSKKKAKSEQAAAAGGNNVKKVTEKMAQFTIIEPPGPTKIKTKPAATSASEPPKPATNNTQQTDPTKRLKNLKKKLREIESIEQKIKSGEIKHPEKDQLEKVSRKVEVTTEIDKLEKMST